MRRDGGEEGMVDVYGRLKMEVGVYEGNKDMRD